MTCVYMGSGWPPCILSPGLSAPHQRQCSINHLPVRGAGVGGVRPSPTTTTTTATITRIHIHTHTYPPAE